MNTVAQIYVVHGYTASPEENWFPWLIQQAQQEKANLKVLRLDPSPIPSLKTWIEQMNDQIDAIDQDSIFIAHSLGCIAVLHYLSEKLKQQQIKQVVLVAGFNERLGRLEEVYPFIDATKIDFELMKNQIAERVVLYSEGDNRVAPKFSLEQAKSLDAQVIKSQHQGHFIDSEGCTELPEIWQIIQKNIQYLSCT